MFCSKFIWNINLILFKKENNFLSVILFLKIEPGNELSSQAVARQVFSPQ